MPVVEAERVVGAMTEAARLTGLRILIGAGWSDLSGLAASLPDDVRLTGAVDHDWLFPRCRAAVGERLRTENGLADAVRIIEKTAG